MHIRLLVVNHTTSYGGAERNLRDLLSRFSPSEVDVLAVVAPGQRRAVPIMQDIGLRCIDLPVPHFAGLRSPAALIKEFLKWGRFRRAFAACLAQESPDLVYASSPHAAIAIEPVLTHACIPWLWQMPDLVKGKRINRFVLQPAIRNSSAIMAISHATAESLIRLGADPSKIHLMYCAVEAKDFDLPAETTAQFRTEQGIEASAPLIGMFGQVTHWKGWHVLVEAIPQVIASFPETRFVFVGQTMIEADQSYQANLKARLAGWGLAQTVIWTGFRQDVPRIMTACDVIVHASVQPEPLGVVIMEGMAARKPVICTQGGGTEEMVQDNDTGLVTPSNDPDALANAINRLLGNLALRIQMGIKGRQVVEARFTHERRVQEFVDVFRQIVAVDRK